MADANPEYPDYPVGQDPTAQFAANLQAAQTQGLPLSGSLAGSAMQPRPQVAPGAAGPLGDILTKDLQTLQQFPQLSAWDRFWQGGARDRAMSNIQKLAPVYGQVRQ